MTALALASISIDGGTHPRAVLSDAESAVLGAYETIIARGLHTFIDVGMALLGIRDGRLYRAQYATFEDYCQGQWGMVSRQANRLIQAAEVAENLRPIGLMPTTESQARPLAPLAPELQREAWQRAVETAPESHVTAAHVAAVVAALTGGPLPAAELEPAVRTDADADVDASQAAGARQAPLLERAPDVPPAEPAVPAWWQSSEDDDWWTPSWLYALLDAEIGFELDVCASDANHKAGYYFTRAQDGLAQPWTGRCWMNPPYGRSSGSSIYDWIAKAFHSAQAGATVACLIPARTDTTWWWNFCRWGEIRFIKGRIKFANSNSIAPFPSAVIIFWPGVPAGRQQVIWWDVNSAPDAPEGT